MWGSLTPKQRVFTVLPHQELLAGAVGSHRLDTDQTWWAKRVVEFGYLMALRGTLRVTSRSENAENLCTAALVNKSY